MYPRDNIFNIYYNIGKRVPFQLKRSRSLNADYRYSKDGKTFMVERVEPRGKYKNRLELDVNSFRSLWSK